MTEETAAPQPPPSAPNVPLASSNRPKRIYICDRCGTPMQEKLCKISCPNCGNRFDCSDLNIYFD